MDSCEEYKNSGIYSSVNTRSVNDGGGGDEETLSSSILTKQAMLNKHQQSIIVSPLFNTSNAARHHTHTPQKRRRPFQTSIQQQYNRQAILKHKHAHHQPRTIHHNQKQNKNKLHRRTIRRAPSGSNAMPLRFSRSGRLAIKPKSVYTPVKQPIIKHVSVKDTLP